jgi:hypothetical protein
VLIQSIAVDYVITYKGREKKEKEKEKEEKRTR